MSGTENFNEHHAHYYLQIYCKWDHSIQACLQKDVCYDRPSACCYDDNSNCWYDSFNNFFVFRLNLSTNFLGDGQHWLQMFALFVNKWSLIVESDFDEITNIRWGRDAGDVFKLKLQNKLFFIKVNAFPIEAKTLSTWVFWLLWSYIDSQARIYCTINKYCLVMDVRKVSKIRARITKVTFHLKRSWAVRI